HWAELKTLSAGLRQHAPRYEAPNALRQKVFAQTRKEIAPLRWLAPLFSGAALAASVALYMVTPPPDAGLVDEAISAPVRSLMGNPLTDVVSSVRHRVKPWFGGRIDFAPSVYDFSDRGYPLKGGRLDYLRHRLAVALVYQHNKHLINLYIMPDEAG